MTREELLQAGFKSLGENVLLSKKTSIYGAGNMEIGSNVRIDDFVFMSGKVSIGNYVHLSNGVRLHGSTEGIYLDDFVTFAPGVTVHADSDDYSGNSLTNPMTPERFKAIHYSTVRIGRHVIIGTGSVVLPGVTIAEGCSVGALSLVKKSTEPWTINAGVPSRVTGARSKKLLEYEKQFLEGECL